MACTARAASSRIHFNKHVGAVPGRWGRGPIVGIAGGVPASSAAIAAVAVRTLTGVRRLLGGFVRAVHPDLTPGFPREALRVNERSLAELNAYVDRLEASEPAPFEAGPEAARELPFFRGQMTRSGRLVQGRVSPLNLPLPALPVSANETQLEYAAACLVRDAEVLLEKTRGGISDKPEVPPLFTQPGAARKGFDRLWWQQTEEAMMHAALYGPDDAQARRQAAMAVFARKYEHQLVRRYTRIQNSQRRRRKLAMVAGMVEEKMKARFGEAPPEKEVQEREAQEDAVRVLRGGFHPDLVFVAPDVDRLQRAEAVRRICGMNLASDADFWLLENLWKAMRSTPPPVPLVVAVSDYVPHVDAGFVQVPWDFTVVELCDLLEEHLDNIRAGLVRRRSQNILGPPPVAQLGLASGNDILEDGDDSEEHSHEVSDDDEHE